MKSQIRRTFAVLVGIVGVLFIVASGGGGGGGDNQVGPATAADIAQAKALTGDFRSFATTFEDIEDPANAFSGTVENAEAVSGKCSAAALDALALATQSALDLYDINSADGTYTFQSDDGQGGMPVDADVVISSPSVSTDQISMTDQQVYGSDGEGGAALNTVDLTITFPVDSDTTTATPLNATVVAEVVCPENGADAGITVSLDGSLTVNRRSGATGPTIEDFGSFALDGDIGIAQTASATVTNPVSILGETTFALSSCTVVTDPGTGDESNECTNQSLVIAGTLSDSTESTSVELAISKTATQGVISIGFSAELDGETRDVEVTFRANISDPENPVLTEVTIEVTGPGASGITITINQFDADGNPTRLVISDGEGGTMTVNNINSDGPIFGNVVVNGKVVGTLEENSNGDLIIRYVDGTFETLA